MSQEFELYKLLSDRIEALRDAQREARRFYILVKTTGASVLFGLQGTVAASALASLGVAPGLVVLDAMWLNATAYYTRSMRFKSQALLELEPKLGISIYADELKLLHRGHLPNSFAERTMIVALIAAYVGLCALLARQPEVASLFRSPSW